MYMLRRSKRLKSLLVIGIIILLVTYVFLSAGNQYTIDAEKSDEFLILNNASPMWTFDADSYIGTSFNFDGDPYVQHAFNILVSNSLPMDRNLKDFRNPSCKNVKLKLSWDATVSVIISFHNEARSALLRTVVSVLNRSSQRLLKDIVLVDDFSKNESDGELLSVLPKVKVIRNEKREGVARSRARGVEASEGKYLVFLDSHCEVNIGWMEHLLNVVQKDYTTLASPVIDIIDPNNFKYKPSSEHIKGGFDWSLNFRWHLTTLDEQQITQSNSAQIFKSPVLLGGLFMAEKSWFQKIGGFDKGLKIWGTENIELSLKTWMCGGKIVVVPCSRVGHVFRSVHPYSFAPMGANLVYLHNSRRLADVWLDDYKEFFYEAKPQAKKVKIGSIDSQLNIKQKLKCKPFQWYIDEIYPDIKPHKKDASAYGKLQQGDLCLLIAKDTTNTSYLQMQQCSLDSSNQEWIFTKSGLIRQNSNCLTADSRRKNQVFLQTCTNSMNQRWIRKKRLLIHSQSGSCLENTHTNRPEFLELNACQMWAYTQKWDFTLEMQRWDE